MFKAMSACIIDPSNMCTNLQIVESDQHQKVKMTVAKVENTKVNIKVKNTLVKFMKVQKCLQGICPLRGADTRRSLSLRAMYGGWKTFMADQLSSLFQRPYLVKECPQLQTYHVVH